jgi:hypothetical protein
VSNKYKNPSDVPLEVICNRLSELSADIAKGDVSDFCMRIPAECDRDADIVLSEAVNRIKSIQAKIDAQAEELKALRKFAENALDCVEFSDIEVSAYELHLLDEYGNPTSLLTGE